MTKTYGTVFADSQYLAIRDKAVKIYRESSKSFAIPLITHEIPDAFKYRNIVLTDPTIHGGTHEWTAKGYKSEIEHGYEDFNLESIQMFLEIKKTDFPKYGDQLIADKQEAIIEKFISDIDDSIFHGILDRAKEVKLNKGLITQLYEGNPVIDLNGTNSTLSTTNDIWKGINKMIDAIPFAMRESSPDMLLYMDEEVAKNLISPDRLTQDSMEKDFVNRGLMGELALNGRKIGQIIVTNKVLALSTDGTDATDTKGTKSRMMLLIPDEKLIARVVSRGFSLIDEEKIMLAVVQLWGWRGGAAVFDVEAGCISEQILWA